MKGKNRASVSLILIAVILISLLLWVYHAQKPHTERGNKNITISVVYQGGARENHKLTTNSKYLKEAAESVLKIQGEKTQYGYTVSSVNGKKADIASGEAYWAIYVNGKYGKYSIDKQPVSDGDVFLFRYEKQ